MNWVVSNCQYNRMPRCFIILISLLVIVLLESCFYYYLWSIKEEKQKTFAEVNSIVIQHLIIKDLALVIICDPSITKLSILKPYSPVNKPRECYEIVGTIIYVTVNQETFIFDLQPILLSIINVLTNNFYYQVILDNNRILSSNVEDREFAYSITYPFNSKNSLTIKLDYIPTSLYLQKFYKSFQLQFLYITIIIVIFSLLLLLGLFILVDKRYRLQKLEQTLIVMRRAAEFNTNYVRSCMELENNFQLPIQLTNTKTCTNRISTIELIEEITTYALAYTARYNYKIELIIIDEIKNVQLNINPIIFRQIIISLLHNILYFMRGGEHIKKLSIKFSNDHIHFTYDSFAANEEHMKNWSRGLFQHLANPYILDCEKIFQLLENSNLPYKVIPKQGKNEVLIFFNYKENIADVIKLKGN